jgi:hypothetical protein
MLEDILGNYEVKGVIRKSLTFNIFASKSVLGFPGRNTLIPVGADVAAAFGRQFV